MTEEGTSSPFFRPRLTSCFPCLNPLIFPTDPMFHSSRASWKVRPHSHFHLSLLHFCSLTFLAYLQLSAILFHLLPPAWRKHPGFLAVKPKHRSKPKLCSHSPCTSIKLEASGSGGSALKWHSHLHGYLHCLYQATSTNPPCSAFLLRGCFWDYLNISCWCSFNYLIAKMKNTIFY